MTSPDLTLFHWINGFAGHAPLVDALMVACAKYAPMVFAGVLLACWATWRLDWQRVAALAGVAALVGLGVGQMAGRAVPRARPSAPTATILTPHAPDSSFPSDHAILACAVTMVLATRSRRLGAVLAFFTVLVLVSRVYVGAHYPADVLGGAVIGGLAALATVRAARLAVVTAWIGAVFGVLARFRLAAR